MEQGFDNLDRRLDQLIRTHLIIFGSWSCINIILGSIFQCLATQAEWYFALMCLSWGCVNALIACWYYFHTRQGAYKEKGISGRT
ncbi:MAG: hypothetical protein AAF828_06985, partial [Bacteroidota bacterium]